MRWVNDVGLYACLEDSNGAYVGAIYRDIKAGRYVANTPLEKTNWAWFSDPLEAMAWVEEKYLRGVLCNG